MRALGILIGLTHAAGMVVSPHRVARPALRLGGEWAGHTVSYASDSGRVIQQSVGEVLTCEEWNDDRKMQRHVVQFKADGSKVASRDVLPLAQSGSETLTLGARMLEPEVLNIRAWALDAADENTPDSWQIEAIFDGLSGDRPAERAGALACPARRTRVQCSFRPSTGQLDAGSPVVVWQERCWSVMPQGNLDAREAGDIDAEWHAAAVGFERFGGTASDGEASRAESGESSTALTLDCGIELRGSPGLLEVTLSSGEGARNGFNSIAVKRSWAGDCAEAGCSVFTEVEVIDDTTGDK